jgi:hypothetical protein
MCLFKLISLNLRSTLPLVDALRFLKTRLETDIWLTNHFSLLSQLHCDKRRYVRCNYDITVDLN